jgi:hypothetical protein
LVSVREISTRWIQDKNHSGEKQSVVLCFHSRKMLNIEQFFAERCWRG